MSSASDPDSAVDVSLPFTFYKTVKKRTTFQCYVIEIEIRNERIEICPNQNKFFKK